METISSDDDDVVVLGCCCWSLVLTETLRQSGKYKSARMSLKSSENGMRAGELRGCVRDGRLERCAFDLLGEADYTAAEAKGERR